ncbi:serine/threonine-protein phosphatase 6 regulatory ankyrin repeat subunit C isoform X6 [Magallana gigas]|uniref:serine/threonine-protein phosphatase 6 regulatory ankyrin repeat subunit C isoform X6 n=1 Tax=Magallana gigas TaxID=29159 RepID=UPI0033416C2A
MSLSKYGSTVETTNLARLARIILGPCTDVLQDVLQKNMNPSDLPSKVKTFLAKFKKSPFTKEQEKIVYTGKYSDFDLTLLYILFRNICTFPQHSHKWGNAPNPGDRSESANIERIRLLRNKYQGHHSSISISSSDFNQEWQAIFDIVKELEMYLGTCTVYQEEVKKITMCCMDPEQEAKYIEQLLDLNKKLDDISVKIENTCVCKKRKELFDREVTRWKEDDKVFLETHNFPAMFNKVVDKPYVTFVGVPGSGKSVTARHIALKLQEEGYDILPIKDICEIETHCNPEILQVFVIDDVVGVLGLDESEFNKLCKYESIIKKPEMKETKVLMTCREVVYRNEYLTNTFLSESANVVKLHSDENLLTEEDKCNMLTMYDLDKKLLSSIDLSLTSKMFPFLCKLYKKEFRNYGASFFMTPYPCILDEMDKMKQRNKIQYASLVLLMFNDSKLSESFLDDDRSSNRSSSFQGKKISVLKRCKVHRETDSFRFIDALSDMEGTYTNKFDSEYTFIHDSMFEIVACHFGRQFPELMIQYMSSDYFANYIKVDGNESENRISENEESTERKASGLCIIISESHYQMLAERLFRDVENGEMLVFQNKTLKHPSVLQTFIDVMARKSYRELYSIFLSELKEDKGMYPSFFQPQMTNSQQLFESFQIWKLLLHEGKRVRAIYWVIYHGHNQILQYIIDQILTENGNVNDLFKNSYKKDVEQFRLLCLGCYSADNTTVKILLQHIDIENIIKTVPYSEFRTGEMDPLTIVCKYGYDKIASELLQASANTNLFWELRRPFVIACGNGHLNVVKQLINAGVNVNGIHNSETPLTAACKAGHVKVADELIKAGADITLADKKETPLMTAFDHGHSQIVELLVKAGSEAINKGGHETSLTIACLKGQLEEVKKIIQAGTDVNLRDGVMTPLVVACYMGHLSVVKEMIKAGADVNLLDGDKTPLTAALLGGHSRVVDELINAGADVNLGDGNDTPLTAACDNGDLTILEELIKAGADVNLKSGCKTPLIIACYEGHLNVVKQLINAGVDVNLRDKDETPLTSACKAGHVKVADELIKAGADITLADKKETPLMTAFDHGHSQIVELLVKAGSEAINKGGHETSLTIACLKGQLEEVKKIIQAGTDVNLRDGVMTPLVVACYMGHLSVVKEMIKAGADVNLLDGDKTPLTAALLGGHSRVVDELINAGADVNLGDGNDTPLTAACDDGNLYVIQELIKAGADVNLKSGCKTPLIIACYEGHLDVVKQLINAGVDVNIEDGDDTPVTAACNDNNVIETRVDAGAVVNFQTFNKTALVVACYEGHFSIVETLIKAGADVNLTGKNGQYTPLIAACEKNDLKTVNVLIRAGADVNLIGKCGEYTPLIGACVAGHLDVVNVFINAGAGVNLQSNDRDYTPLIAACMNNHLNLVDVLTKAGADVNMTGRKNTPLAAACQGGYLKVVDVLLKCGADVNLAGETGEFTPLIAASQGGHLEVFDLLVEAGADLNCLTENGSDVY